LFEIVYSVWSSDLTRMLKSSRQGAGLAGYSGNLW